MQTDPLLTPASSPHLPDAPGPKAMTAPEKAQVAKAKAAAAATATPVEPPVKKTEAPQASAMAMSFEVDAHTKSLTVVMTDAASGEVVRKISLKGLHGQIHQTGKLLGAMVDTRS